LRRSISREGRAREKEGEGAIPTHNMSFDEGEVRAPDMVKSQLFEKKLSSIESAMEEKGTTEKRERIENSYPQQ